VIIDLNSLDSATPVRSEVCIVGCGAIGMAMARELNRHRIDTVVVDGGAERDEPQTQALYDCEMVGLTLGGATDGRFRVLGGSTTRWGGQALPMDAIDFERRDWVAHSGWPIRMDEVARYYSQVAEYMDIDDADYEAGLARDLRAVAPAVDQRVLRYHFSKWAPQPNLRRLYLADFRRAPHLRLLTHANVTRIDLTQGRSAVERLTVRSLQGCSATIEAHYVILCTGGIENARLLLTNDHQVQGGIGNEHDVVGRFLQDHPTARAATIEASSSRRLQAMFNQYYRRGRKYAVRLSASTEFQCKFRTLNLSSGITFEAPADSAVGALKRVHGRLLGRACGGTPLTDLLALGKSATSLILPAYEYVVRGRQYVPNATYTVHVISEQEPDPSSRVSLAEQRDALGVRKARIDWRLQPSVARSVRLFAQTLSAEFNRLQLGRLRLARGLAADDEGYAPVLADANHHIGTTRMSDDPRSGVVDARCKVHGIDNLYVGGSSVFPTGGHSNPTFTALALAFRTCAELRHRAHG
jgi:choline dehydrogenase-like flavoprotein